MDQFVTGAIAAFAPGSVKPFKSFQVPNWGFTSYITSAAVDSAAGYLSIGFVRYESSSAFPRTWIATRRLSDKRLLNVTEVAFGGSRTPPVNGMTFDSQDRLYVSYGNSVHVFGSLDQKSITDLGVIKSKVFRTPGGLFVSGGERDAVRG